MNSLRVESDGYVSLGLGVLSFGEGEGRIGWPGVVC